MHKLPQTLKECGFCAIIVAVKWMLFIGKEGEDPMGAIVACWHLLQMIL